MSPLEIAAVIISFLAIWLTARRHMLCWPVGLLSCALYFKLFLDVRLYADMMLQILFGLSVLYGWWAWYRDRDGAGEVIIRRLSRTQAVAGLAAGALGSWAIGWFTSHYTDASLPWIDATLSSFSLVAQYWTARRYPANWLLWIVVDVIYVGMFLFKALWLTAGLYAAMIALAAIGYARWRKIARNRPTEGGTGA
ncbi:nicotinamide riboside transporter PnuC [Sphingomonas abietis]|uniref:Nicotinamide riboside transporter PnuC n=1 Tax=Sphingomonas abietis TaxID=3012344 RepID=A0ABY7NLA2_9SPHN|nr:nicotinamide riboside transporter PnuC [Sphingomonas abietis]WBO22279.1 nicotinamide riboside transporter PnuC [Sphingomonas abietis]